MRPDAGRDRAILELLDDLEVLRRRPD